MTNEMLDVASPAARLPAASCVRQKLEFRSGNEAAALAARDIGFHMMGFFPITPSTEVAENLSKMSASGEHEIVMVAGDGEHLRFSYASSFEAIDEGISRISDFLDKNKK